MSACVLLRTSLEIDSVSTKKCYERAIKARNNLLHKNDRDELSTKVCCICDRFIFYGKERFIPINDLTHEAVQEFLSVDENEWDYQEVSSQNRRKIKDQYTQKCIRKCTTISEQLNKLMLSPRTYMVKKTYNKVETSCFGSCCACYQLIIKLTRGDSVTVPPFSIANKKYFRYAPFELTDLNECELALISPARINRHLITLYAGSHQQITGWHTLFQNDLSRTSKILNYYERCSKRKEKSEAATTDENANMGVKSNNDDENNSEPLIQVVLTGPWTDDQKALAYKKTQVRVSMCIRALKWLKKNNVLYKDIDIDQTQIVEPKIIYYSITVESQDSNVENIYQVTAVFPDVDPPTQDNGGFETHEEFKLNTIENLAGVNHTLIAKSSNTILRDYQGKNLLEAFPLLFPYGIGEHDGNQREFYQYFGSLSDPNWHKGQFVTIIHNIYERQRMLSAAITYTSHEDKMAIGNLKEDELDIYIDKYLDENESSDCPSDYSASMFMKKLKSVTSAMAHTQAASKSARRKMFSMVLKFGLPTLLFTITPEHSINLRIKIVATN